MPTKKKRSADRHGPRKMIAFDPAIYNALAKLADRNSRPLSWEAARIIREALEKEGLLRGQAE